MQYPAGRHLQAGFYAVVDSLLSFEQTSSIKEPNSPFSMFHRAALIYALAASCCKETSSLPCSESVLLLPLDSM